MPDIVIHAVTAAAYAGLAWHFWRSRWRTRPAIPTAATGTRPWERAALLVPLVLHAFLLYSELFAPRELRFGFAQALSV
ncbi:MAG: inner membrane protein YpjD, partial [Burkholderiales bacterium]